MRQLLAIGVVVAMAAVAPLLAVAAPGTPQVPVPLPAAGGTDDVLGLAPRDAATPAERLVPVHGLVPRAPGTIVHTTLVYGPYPIPSGNDLNRLSLDVPAQDGFVTRLAYRLVDSATGQPYDNMQVHIHHALWFRGPPGAVIPDFDHFLFGTGEERTTLDFDARADAVPGGPRYGIPLQADLATEILLMLHNKQAANRVVNILIDVTFVHGTAAQIASAPACDNPPGLEGDGCIAGQAVHALLGRLWGDIYDVPRQAGGSGLHVYPNPATSRGILFTSTRSGHIVQAIGHVHVNGLATVIANLGPAGSACEADLDGDGYPGITILRSDKLDRNMAAWPTSEDMQMGVSQPAWRAPLRVGDRITQFGEYRNSLHASYQAMAFAALHVDVDAPPAPRGGPCTVANTGAFLVGGATGSPSSSVPNRPWDGPPLPLCGPGLGPACDRPVTAPPSAPAPGNTVLIAGYAYLPGDLNLAGPLAAPPRVPQGTSLTFVNADTAGVIRHTVTTCAWPCNGPYRANYPLPDGVVESDRLGNYDYLDQGSVPPNEGDDPVWRTPPDLAPGLYSYYCRLHPFMRGAFEVTAA